MIIENRITRISTLNEDNNINMTISNDPKIFMMLSSNIYEHKIRAVIRELCCNAKDSHTAAKNVNPFFVHIPTVLEPYFYVEDFGVGLSDSEVREIYTVYGESTKTKSNDMIGALGIGSKSPFAYTDIFEVRTRKNGIQNIYIVSKGDTFAFTKISESKTEESNGVRVKFDVDKKDYYEFQNEFKYCMKYFNYMPDNNFSFTKNNITIIDSDQIEYYPKQRIYSEREITCVMGGVPYTTKFNIDKFENYLKRNNIDNELINVYLNAFKYIFPNVLFFEMGTLEFNPSRERLTLTPTCIDTINKKVFSIYEKVINEYVIARGNIKTPYDIIMFDERFPFSLDTFILNGVDFNKTVSKRSPMDIFNLNHILNIDEKLIDKNDFSIRMLENRKNTKRFLNLPLTFFFNSDYNFLMNIEIIVILNDTKYKTASLNKNILSISGQSYIKKQMQQDSKTPIFVILNNKNNLLSKFTTFVKEYMFYDCTIINGSNINDHVTKNNQKVIRNKRVRYASNELKCGVYNREFSKFIEMVYTITDNTYYVDSVYFIESKFDISGRSVKNILDIFSRTHDIIMLTSTSSKKISNNKVKPLSYLIERNIKIYQHTLINHLFDINSHFRDYIEKIKTNNSKYLVFKDIKNKYETIGIKNDYELMGTKHNIELILKQETIDRYNLQQIIDIYSNFVYNESILKKYDDYFDCIQPINNKYYELKDIIINNIVSETDKNRLIKD